ncbi:fibroleukin-like [Saccostrea cucullata]|uniref:fibroleukin-like n=1 Tax=Saccostrea cuccullata TaxID=36930 RepID=UPI002ED0F6D3
MPHTLAIPGILKWEGAVWGRIRADCKDLHKNGHTNSGVYEIYPDGTNTSPIRVFCDMDTKGGGWTVIQKRVDGSQSFDKDWEAYKNGFGTLDRDVWIGNDIIHQLTKGNHSSLYVSITPQDGTSLYELYDKFAISDETEKYKLFLEGPATGTLGDSMLNTGYRSRDLSGMYFSTPDRDNDQWIGSCAAYFDCRGGWWFNSCYLAFLNGPWSSNRWDWPWYPTITSGTSVKETLMMIRRH